MTTEAKPGIRNIYKNPLGASGFESATQTKILNTLAG